MKVFVNYLCAAQKSIKSANFCLIQAFYRPFDDINKEMRSIASESLLMDVA